jgi:hypothetical protein
MITYDKIAMTGFLCGCLFGTFLVFYIDIEKVCTPSEANASHIMTAHELNLIHMKTVYDLYLIPIVRAGYPWVKGFNSALDNGFNWIHVTILNIAVAIFECLESIARFFCNT